MFGSQHLLKKTIARWARLIRETRGQDMVEYALLAGFFAVAAGATLPPIAESVGEIFTRTHRILNNAAGTNGSPTDEEPSEA